MYTDVITLAEAKTYLRVDDTLTEDDANITRMIESALRYVENYTNVLVYARDIEYINNETCVRVYEAPINTVVSDVTDTITYPLYTIYEADGNITLNVGYVTPTDVPQDLREVAFEIIDIYYYGKETGKTMTDLSPLAKDTLNQNKRFIV